MTLDVPTAEEIMDEIRDDVEYLETGNWIISEIETDEYQTVRQRHEMFGREGALKKIAKHIRKKKRRESKHERDKKRRKERMETEKELREERKERMQERLERERSHIEDIIK